MGAMVASSDDLVVSTGTEVLSFANNKQRCQPRRPVNMEPLAHSTESKPGFRVAYLNVATADSGNTVLLRSTRLT